MKDSAEQFEKIWNEIQDHDLENIYNVDEAVLFYKMSLHFIYCIPYEKNVRGIKQSKDRVTFIFCCNMTGTHKLSLVMIGKVKKPHCFNRGTPSIQYYSSPNAWINSNLFHRWFEEVFEPSVTIKTNKRFCLFLIITLSTEFSQQNQIILQLNFLEQM